MFIYLRIYLFPESELKRPTHAEIRNFDDKIEVSLKKKKILQPDNFDKLHPDGRNV